MAGKKIKKSPDRSSRKSIVSVDPLRKYLSEISVFAPLSPEEENTLATELRSTGDPEAAYRLVTANLKVVVKIAFQFRRAWVNLLDLIQEGNIGLLLAVKKFDPLRGVRLSSYATWWIRAYMIKFILDNWKLVKVGTTNTRRKLLFNLSREIRQLESEGFRPEPKLLAQRLDADVSDVIDVQRSLSVRDVSLDTPSSEDERSRHEILPSTDQKLEDQILDREFSSLVEAKIKEFSKDLDDKERCILEHRLKAETPLTLQEIGDRFGVTREAVRQTESRLVAKLKAFMARELKDYAGVKFDIEAS